MTEGVRIWWMSHSIVTNLQSASALEMSKNGLVFGTVESKTIDSDARNWDKFTEISRFYELIADHRITRQGLEVSNISLQTRFPFSWWRCLRHFLWKMNFDNFSRWRQMTDNCRRFQLHWLRLICAGDETCGEKFLHSLRTTRGQTRSSEFSPV